MVYLNWKLIQRGRKLKILREEFMRPRIHQLVGVLDGDFGDAGDVSDLCTTNSPLT